RNGLPAYDAGVLTADVEVADYFEATVAAGADAKKASNWIMGEMLRHTRDRGASEWSARVPAALMARVIQAVESVAVTAAGGKAILEQVFLQAADPEALFATHAAKSSADDLLPLVRQVVD